MTALALLAQMDLAGITVYIREDGALRIRGNLAAMTTAMRVELRAREKAVRAAILLAVPLHPDWSLIEEQTHLEMEIADRLSPAEEAA